MKLLGWRDVPVRSEILGKASLSANPLCVNFSFIKRICRTWTRFERKLYIVRRLSTYKLRYAENADDSDLHQFII